MKQALRRRGQPTSTARLPPAPTSSRNADAAQTSPETSGVAREPSAACRAQARPQRLAAVPIDARRVHAFSLLPDFILYPLDVLGGYLAFLFDRRHVAIAMVIWRSRFQNAANANAAASCAPPI